MTVNTAKLVLMAEQISANMNYGEDSELVASRAADHINKFWDKRMTSALKEHARCHQSSLSVELQDLVSKLC